jgi:hypothetical protein
MVRKDPYAPKRPAAEKTPLTHEQGCWIKYRLNLRNVTYRTVAYKAGVCEQTVAHFLNGGNTNEGCRAALCKLLGYDSFEALLDAGTGKVLGVENLPALFADMPKGGKA